MLKSRIITKCDPAGLGTDGLSKLLLVVLLEELGFDTSCVVRRGNGRVLGVLGRERNTDRVSRLGFDLRKRLFQVLFELKITPAVIFALFFIGYFSRILILLVGFLGFSRGTIGFCSSVCAGPTSLLVTVRAALPTLFMSVAVPVTVVL